MNTNLIFDIISEQKKVPLTLTAAQNNSTVLLSKTGGGLVLDGLQYRTNKDLIWRDYIIDTSNSDRTSGELITLKNIGDFVQFRNTKDQLSKQIGIYSVDPIVPARIVSFIMTGKIYGSGNCMSMINYSKECKNYCFCQLFASCSSLITPPQILCEKTALSCFAYMFDGCNNLIRVPKLTANNIVHTCYAGMFRNCTSLTTVPKDLLPITEFPEWTEEIKNGASCYRSMFEGCINLLNAPDLPATKLTYSCYQSMFKDCISLINPPKISAIELAPQCFYQMFYYCTSLTSVPELHNNNVCDYSFYMMFKYCRSITSIPRNYLPVTELAPYCYNGMFDACYSLTNVCELPATKIYHRSYCQMFEECISLSAADIRIGIEMDGEFCCTDMFNICTSLIIPPQLPALDLVPYCYQDMFKQCYSLKNLPELPATGLADYCYINMFNGCGVPSIPENLLPATELAQNCYQSMFQNCDSLTYIPQNLLTSALEMKPYCYQMMFRECTSLTSVTLNLPAMKLDTYCYRAMFGWCSSLISTNINLPAMDLASGCYKFMFHYCPELINTPQLPATGLVEECYNNMFNNTKVDRIEVNFTQWNLNNATQNWVSAVSPTGTFIKPSGLQEIRDSNHIPNGWTIINK